MKKIITTKNIHIMIIILGTIFVSLSAFHTNLWFDESYSVALATHSFKEIWQIGGHDVHPILYYWLLHIVYLIFGTNIIVYRLFSVLWMTLLGIIGFTHIRKDFGEKTGIIFTCLTFFMPVMCVYAPEIRMYSLACFLGVLMCIYAYRILKQNTKKNWIIFGVSSLALAYTHYYGLMTAGIVNILLFIFTLKKKNENKNYLKYFIIQAIIQIVLYVPWLVYFVIQVTSVGKGFWISVKFPDTLVEILSFQYRGIMDGGVHLNIETIGTLCFSILTYIYIGYIIYKQNKEKNEILPGIITIGIYLTIIIAAWLISFVMQILYYRYLFVITGILIFAISYFMAKGSNKVITIILISLITIMAGYNEVRLSYHNYHESNMKQVEYIQEHIQENDIIIYSNAVADAIFTIYFPNNNQYFINLENWDVEEAYKAFSPTMTTIRNLDFLDDYNGRIWIIDSDEQKLYNLIKEKNVKTILDNIKVETEYHNSNYNIMLIEK